MLLHIDGIQPLKSVWRLRFPVSKSCHESGVLDALFFLSNQIIEVHNKE
jgi:hypothetical protein